MRRGRMLNSEIVSSLSKLGHTDTITIADAGLPIPENVKRIDLSLVKGTPSFLEVLDATKKEMVVEKAIIAKEIVENNTEVYNNLKEMLKDIEIELVSHEQFKDITKDTRAIIRTGEFTPYANIILIAGVDFNGDDYE